jgi:hypothetical protein
MKTYQSRLKQSTQQQRKKKEKKKGSKMKGPKSWQTKNFRKEDKSLSERMRTNQVLNWGAPKFLVAISMSNKESQGTQEHPS